MISYEAYLRAHFASFGVLIIELGRFCPVECAHCHVESDTSTHDHLALRKIGLSIAEFSSLPSAEFVSLTGGEPFSYRRALRNALVDTRSAGLSSFVLTSAVWAETGGLARTRLAYVGVPDLLAVSIDAYHLKRVPIERPIHALRVALELGTEPFIALGSLGPSDPIREQVKSALREAGLGQLQIVNYPLLARGKGAGLPELSGRTLSNESDECCLSIGTPVLTATGAITACCHTTVANTARAGRYDQLVLGNHVSIQAAHASFLASELMQTVHRYGPMELARREGILVPEEISRTDICETCDFVRGALRDRASAGSLESTR